MKPWFYASPCRTVVHVCFCLSASFSLLSVCPSLLYVHIWRTRVGLFLNMRIPSVLFLFVHLSVGLWSCMFVCLWWLWSSTFFTGLHTDIIQLGNIPPPKSWIPQTSALKSRLPYAKRSCIKKSEEKLVHCTLLKRFLEENGTLMAIVFIFLFFAPNLSITCCDSQCSLVLRSVTILTRMLKFWQSSWFSIVILRLLAML